MGRTVTELVRADSSLKLIGGVDAGESISDIIDNADVIIDFSHVSATIPLLDAAVGAGKALVIGTTGHTDEHKELFRAAALKIPLLISPNMSEGVNLLYRLAEMASKTIGKNCRVEIIETHHIHKKDAPSGTAKKLVEIMRPYISGDIPIESIREGEIVGDHRIIFTTEGDKLEFFHSAFTREIFARGAIRAAKWIVGRPAGLYSMQDVLFD